MEPEDEIICDCSGTRRSKILSLIDAGVIEAEQISRKTGAISGCAACEWTIEQLIDTRLGLNAAD